MRLVTLPLLACLLLYGCAAKRQSASVHTDSHESTAHFDRSLLLARIDSLITTLDFSFDSLEVVTQGAPVSDHGLDSVPAPVVSAKIYNGRLTASRSEYHHLDSAASLRDSVKSVGSESSVADNRTDFSAVYSPSAAPWLLLLIPVAVALALYVLLRFKRPPR